MERQGPWNEEKDDNGHFETFLPETLNLLRASERETSTLPGSYFMTPPDGGMSILKNLGLRDSFLSVGFHEIVWWCDVQDKMQCFSHLVAREYFNGCSESGLAEQDL